MTLLAYERNDCTGGVVACGAASFALPLSTAAVDVPVRCQHDGDGSPLLIDEVVCLNQSIPPDRCSTAPSGDGSTGRDASSGAVLSAVALLDDGTCSESRIDHVDSLAVALYSLDDVLVRKTCVSLSSTAQRLVTLTDALSEPIFNDLNGGEYRLVFTAYDDSNCPDDEVLLCGGSTVSIPLDGTPEVTVACFDQSEPITDLECFAAVKK